MKKNRLLVITNGFPQISTPNYHCQFVYEQTRLIKDLFDEIVVISPQPYFPRFLQKVPNLAGYSKLSGFHDYKTDNIRVFYPSYLTLPTVKFRERNHLKMRRVIQDTIKKENLQYDFVHVHFLYPTGEAAIDIFPANVKKALSLHGGDLYKWALNPKNRERARKVLSGYDRLQVPSKYLERVLYQLAPDISKARVYVIPPSVDENIFFPATRNRSKIVLMVSNLVEGKGHYDALKAFAEVKKRVAGAKLVIIGTGPLYGELKQKITEMGLTKEVSLVGSLAHRTLPKWYQEASVLLFPSYAESFGIVQIEALACGLPVIAYDNEGSREIFAEYPECLVKTGDIDELGRKLESILLSKTRKNIVSSIANKYTTGEILSKLKVIYG